MYKQERNNESTLLCCLEFTSLTINYLKVNAQFC
jgi:hypothetical protein